MSATISRAERPREIAGLLDKNVSPDSNPELFGQGVKVAQIEMGIFSDHESVKHKKFDHSDGQGFPPPPCSFISTKRAIHGTAVASIICDKNFGIASSADLIFRGPRNADECRMGICSVLRRLTADERFKKELNPGDIVSISMQTKVFDYDKNRMRHFPIDVNDDVREILNEFYEYGVTTFIAAGNSSLNLDKDEFETRNLFGKRKQLNYFERTHNKSKAVKIGYTSDDAADLDLSNYGTDVRFFAPAGSVLAACYNLGGNKRTTDLLGNYSGGFARTSASTPIIASIAACIQGRYKELKKNPEAFLEPDILLDLMEDYSSEPITHSHGRLVGVKPNLYKVFEKLEEM